MKRKGLDQVWRRLSAEELAKHARITFGDIAIIAVSAVVLFTNLVNRTDSSEAWASSLAIATSVGLGLKSAYDFFRTEAAIASPKFSELIFVRTAIAITAGMVTGHPGLSDPEAHSDLAPVFLHVIQAFSYLRPFAPLLISMSFLYVDIQLSAHYEHPTMTRAVGFRDAYKVIVRFSLLLFWFTVVATIVVYFIGSDSFKNGAAAMLAVALSTFQLALQVRFRPPSKKEMKIEASTAVETLCERIRESHVVHGFFDWDDVSLKYDGSAKRLAFLCTLDRNPGIQISYEQASFSGTSREILTYLPTSKRGFAHPFMNFIRRRKDPTHHVINFEDAYRLTMVGARTRLTPTR